MTSENTTAPTADTAAPTTDTAAPTIDTVPTPEGFYDSRVVHTIDVLFDQAAYTAMIDTFQSNGNKDWIEAAVTIDGQPYRQVGMRLKGNSSLIGLRDDGAGAPTPLGVNDATADEPEELPWLIQLDLYIADQQHEGFTEFAVRSSSTETAMNEAVSVELLEEADMATQQAVAVRFTVNDRPQTLRLVLENPNSTWTAQNLGSGNLYKADAEGDYSYRGGDPADYGSAWEQEAGEADLGPLIDFLDFINNADDATFSGELPERLSVEAFADYLAIEDLLANFDDISGPGNNSMLYFDRDAGRFTVVAWDHNLALAPLPFGQPPPGGPRPLGGNVLEERFRTVTQFVALYDDALERLRAELYDSGFADSVLERWRTVLLRDASDLVDEATIQSEADSIAEYFVPK